MKQLSFSLSSILLASLTVPIVMTYQIFPGDTNFIQFGLIFLLLVLNFVLDILKLSEKKYFQYKSIIFWTLLFLVVGGAFISAIMVRHKVAPIFQVHDIILQLEAAIRFFLDGINPWSATYHNTFMAQWHYSDTSENPALYHFVMMPFYLIFSLPFYFISNRTLGYFDGRIPLYFLYFTLLLISFRLIKDREKKFVFTSLIALSPAMFAYTLEGRSDIFMFSFFISGIYFLQKRSFNLAGILIALAFLIKQSIWPILPLYFSYVYFVSSGLRKTIVRIIAFILTFFAGSLPFFIWDPVAFLNSTIFYLSGNTVHSYPISGYGFGMVLYQLGFIKDLLKPYPFIMWQIIFVVPVLILLLIYLKKFTNIKSLLFAYGILAFVYWYFSRYFNNSHVGYLTMVFITAYFWPVDPDKNENKK